MPPPPPPPPQAVRSAGRTTLRPRRAGIVSPSVVLFPARVRAAERVAHAHPRPERGSRTAELGRARGETHCRPEALTRSGEEILSENPEVIVTRVEHIVHTREQLEVPAEPATAIETHQHVAGQPPVAIGIVLVA